MWKLKTDSYNVELTLSDDLTCSFNRIWEKDVFDLDSYIKNLPTVDDHSIIVLWSADTRFNLNDQRIIRLNDFYHSIKNPMVIFTGVLDLVKPNFIDFHCLGINLFQQIAKISQPQDRPIFLKKSKKYLFMSTKDYLSRRYILQHLLNNNFEDQGIIAYKCLQKAFNENFRKNTEYIKNACESIEDRIPIIGFDGPLYNYDQVPEDVINDTYLSIITETYYQGPIYFSEKIYHAMLYNHFFIYLGPVHSLKYLKSLGFKTWGHIIDESYDDIEDPAERLFAVARETDTFLCKSLDEITQLYIENIDIINHNRKLIATIDIDQVVSEALTMAKSIR
jgi:hypothetical protein